MDKEMALVRNILLTATFPAMNEKGFKGLIPINNLDEITMIKAIVETKTGTVVNSLDLVYKTLDQMVADGELVKVGTVKHKPAKDSFIKTGYEYQEIVNGKVIGKQYCYFPPREMSEKAIESYRKGQEMAEQFDY